MALSEHIDQPLSQIIKTLNSSSDTTAYEFLIAEGLRIIDEIERTLGDKLTDKHSDIENATTTLLSYFDTPRDSRKNITIIAEYFNTFKYYVEGVTLTPIASVGLLGR